MTKYVVSSSLDGDRMVKPMQAVVPLCCMLFLFFLLDSSIAAMTIRVPVKSGQGDEKEVDLYRGSYALLIGTSCYRAGWSSLESIPGELDEVEKLLEHKGFKVERIYDPDSEQLQNAFTGFINRYGHDPNNRLLFFYAGHGYSREKEKKEYLVPVDAPDPDKDEKGFLAKALDMNQILTWSWDIEARHVLFLFDSCFSGTIIQQRDRAEIPKHISHLSTQPVRQFIAACQAGESIPANSTFTHLLVDALKFGTGDLNKDGYVSGTELGLFLEEKVPLHANQSPLFGKIQDPDLSRGDFIFVAGEPEAKLNQSPVQPPSIFPSAVYTEPSAEMEFVWVNGGCFQMGQTVPEREHVIVELGEEQYKNYFNDELPVHEVCVEGFWMGKYEVTQKQWQRVMGDNPAYFDLGADFPVEQVSWNDVQKFISRLNQGAAKLFRLPTEAEWEYAARAHVSNEVFSGGNDANAVAWFDGNSDRTTHRVGTKKPNRLGLYDMSGNVWEWCADRYYDKYYSVSIRNNPKGPSSGKERVGRGGSWGDPSSYIRVSYRDWNEPDQKSAFLGFRIVAQDK